MKRIKSKFLVYLIVTLIACASFVSISQAAAVKKTFAVLFGGVYVNYNNQDVTSKVTPIMVNGRTYLPVRSMANLFNKNLSLSGNTIYLSDTTDSSASLSSTIASLQSELASKDAYIQTLTQKISSLESTIATLNSNNSNNNNNNNNNSTSINLDKLEDDLNDDYESYKNVEFDISLSGDSSNISVVIKTDEEDWSGLKYSYQKKYMQNIVNDIHAVKSSAAIEGKIKDGSSVLIAFSAVANGDLVVDVESLLEDLKDDLEDQLDDEAFGTLTDIDNDDLEITAEGDLDDLTFKINIDYSDYEDEWDELADNSETAIEDYMKKVYDYIVAQSTFDDTKVVGYFYDTDDKDNLAKLYNDGKSFKIY
ncbi:MAG: stalk domain-containing protein [Ignavibacteriales bacterium]